MDRSAEHVGDGAESVLKVAAPGAITTDRNQRECARKQNHRMISVGIQSRNRVHIGPNIALNRTNPVRSHRENSEQHQRQEDSHFIDPKRFASAESIS
jgi:hypothetical protein